MRDTDGNVFLVIEPDPTVARDLEESLLALDPAAIVRTIVARAPIRDALEGLDCLTAAFLRLPAEEMRSAEIPGAVEARGGRVVVLDVPPTDPPAEAGRGWLYMGRPFGSQAVAGALRRMGIGATAETGCGGTITTTRGQDAGG